MTAKERYAGRGLIEAEPCKCGTPGCTLKNIWSIGLYELWPDLADEIVRCWNLARAPDETAAPRKHYPPAPHAPPPPPPPPEKTAAQAEPRRMYELDGSGSDEKPAGAAVAESRLVFPASDTEQAPHDCPTSKQAIERLCALMSAVNERIFKCEGPADCVCPGAFRDPSGYRNDGRAVEFIEAAVRVAMGKTESENDGKA